jgi:hypothetical protein
MGGTDDGVSGCASAVDRVCRNDRDRGLRDTALSEPLTRFVIRSSLIALKND